MYREVLQGLAAELARETARPVVKGRPIFGQTPLAVPVVALLCDAFPEPPTRNGACAGGGALGWTVTAFGKDEAEGLALIESILTWLARCPSFAIGDKRVTVRRSGSGERQPNEQDVAELEHAFSVPITTHW